MATKSPNANEYRRAGPGLLLAAAYPFLRILTGLLARPADPRAAPRLLVYQSYQVGDFFMALPAIRLLARNLPVTVIGRPDCLFALEGLGAEAVGFECPFFSRATPRAFLASLRNAWALRRALPAGTPVLDLEADPRTAFFLKVAGLGPLVSYRRRSAYFFDRLLPLPAGVRHQSAKSEALAEAFVRDPRLAAAAGAGPNGAAPGTVAAPKPGLDAPAGGLLLSCWTRKDTKNWPFAHWDAFLAGLIERGRPLRIVVPPDGDAGFQAFRSRWEGRVAFLAGGLPEMWAAVRGCDGVVATDNFLGHMAAWAGKPVLWINGSSDPEHVAPRAHPLRIVQVEPMPCRPCRHRCVNPVHKECLNTLEPSAVLAAADGWLRELPAAGPVPG